MVKFIMCIMLQLFIM